MFCQSSLVFEKPNFFWYEWWWRKKLYIKTSSKENISRKLAYCKCFFLITVDGKNKWHHDFANVMSTKPCFWLVKLLFEMNGGEDGLSWVLLYQWSEWIEYYRSIPFTFTYLLGILDNDQDTIRFFQGET